jgi:hypothetical protein
MSSTAKGLRILLVLGIPPIQENEALSSKDLAVVGLVTPPPLGSSFCRHNPVQGY